MERTENERNKCEQQLNLTKTKVENYSTRLLELQQEIESLSSEMKALLDDKAEQENQYKNLTVQMDTWEKLVIALNFQLK